jgi:uncharacterized membrane protein
VRDNGEHLGVEADPVKTKRLSALTAARTRRIAAVLMALMGLGVSTALAPAFADYEIPKGAGGNFNICNKTSSTVHLAIAYYFALKGNVNDPHSVSQGWWNLAPGDCRILFPPFSLDGRRWYYAESDTRLLWKGDVKFCVRPLPWPNDSSRFYVSDLPVQGPEIGFYPGSPLPPCRAPFVELGFHVFGGKDLDLAE